MGAITDLFKSERGFFSLVLVAAVSAMVFTDRATIDQWIEYTKWIAGFYVASKTVQGVVSTLKPAPVAVEAPAPAVASAAPAGDAGTPA